MSYKTHPPALCVWQPAQRLIVLHAWLEDEPGWEAFDVLGVEATAGTADDDGAEVRHSPIILIDDRLQTLRDAEKFYFNGLTELLLAGWPADEDGERLQPIASKLHHQLRRRKELESRRA
jgi:hypothetical protein